MSEKKIRLFLWGMVSAIVLLVFSFLWIINLNKSAEMMSVMNNYIILLGVFTVIAMGIFFFVMPIKNNDGKLERSQILVVTSVVLVIAQLAFVYASFAYTQTRLSFDTLESATNIYNDISEDDLVATKYIHSDGKWLQEYSNRYLEICDISIISKRHIVTDSSNQAYIGEYLVADPLEYYSFQVDGSEIVLHISQELKEDSISKLLAELLTIMAASIFLTIELLMFGLKFLENKITPPELVNGLPRCQALMYIRPLAFVFYFSSKIAGSFIPLVAKELGGNFLGMKGDLLTSIPQSSETLFTCVAIFLTSMIIEKKGWKMSFVGGLFLVAGGTLLSAFSFNIVLFIVARSLVGLGYGFSWMTLRNLSLFGRNQEEKAVGFSLLNAGIYAGINCGSVLGAVLAESFGYQKVFLIATVFTVLCSIFILRMENQVYKRPVIEEEPKKETIRITKKDNMQVVILALFVILMIAPTAIVGAFLSYYLPIYFTGIGYGIADVGRAQLLYGVLIIYLGPYLVKLSGLKKWTQFYSILIASTLILFGLFGGFALAMVAVLIIGLADSFGFVMQNNYFLGFKVLRNMGESASLSMLSFLKKMAEMVGPMTFALFMNGTNTLGIALLGSIFLGGTIFYILLCSKRELLTEEVSNQ